VRRPTVSLATYLGCGAAGLAVGMVSGIVLSVAPLGALFFLPLLLTGVLVGEAVSAVARRRAARGLAGLAFGCAVVGPILGQAALLAPRLPVADPTVRAHLTLAVALQSLGPLGLLLLAVAGAVAASRITRGW
jgi:hypothetical protein